MLRNMLLLIVRFRVAALNGVKSDLGWRWRSHHLPQNVGDRPDLTVMQLDRFRQPRQLLGELARRCQQSSQAHEGAHDFDIDASSGSRAKNAAEHGDAMFRENAGRLSLAAPT